MYAKRTKKKNVHGIHLHETYIDKIIADEEFSVQDGEGHLHKPVSKWHLHGIGLIFTLCIVAIIFRVGYLQLVQGEHYAHISENNTFDRMVVLPARGTIYDRNKNQIAWNVGSVKDEVPERTYHGEGFSSLIGFIRYPKKDASNNYYRKKTEGEGGVEQKYNELLAGSSGSIVLEKDVSGKIVSQLHLEKPTDGEDVVTTIDIAVQRAMYKAIKEVAEDRSFHGASGAMMDITNGEVIAMASYPDFDNNMLVSQSKKVSKEYLQEQEGGIFMNRAVSGLYSPGSTVKPFFAVAALEEDIVSPEDIITSKGFITVQNPYDKNIVYTYKDWKEHGDLTMYDAIAWSSNVYFYHVGGGYGEMKEGLGIDRLNFYAEMFGLGRSTEIGTFHEPPGLIPNPKWKKGHYNEAWTIGDTYNTVIGQYSFQVTPLQLVRATATIANGGSILEPHLNKGTIPKKIKLAISEESLSVVQQGMRETITKGTAKVLNSKNYTLAVKTGTAQVASGGVVNSLITGFFPYENPKYAFVIVMERGTQEGSSITATKIFFEEMVKNASEYL